MSAFLRASFPRRKGFDVGSDFFRHRFRRSGSVHYRYPVLKPFGKFEVIFSYGIKKIPRKAVETIYLVRPSA